MARKKSKGTAYNGGHIRATPRGTFRAEIYVDGKQQRPTFKTREEAEGYIDRVRMTQERRSVPLTMTELVEAREALDMLPEGVGLLEVVRQWVRGANMAEAHPVVAREALDTMIAEKVALGLRKRSAQSLSHHVGRFLEDFPGLCIHEITTAQFRDWLTANSYRGETWNNYRRDLHSFLGWCVREKHIATNPATEVPKARSVSAMPACFAVADVKAFLDMAAKVAPEVVPFFATAFFAGIRSAELDRMTSDCFGPEYIHVGAGQAKIGQQRFVTILPTLAKWLEAFPPTGPLRLPGHRRQYRAILKALAEAEETQGFAWVDNGARHSFASYHLAAFRDAGRTAHELGHQNASLLYNRYRTLATEADGVAYFAIIPGESNTD